METRKETRRQQMTRYSHFQLEMYTKHFLLASILGDLKPLMVRLYKSLSLGVQAVTLLECSCFCYDQLLCIFFGYFLYIYYYQRFNHTVCVLVILLLIMNVLFLDKNCNIQKYETSQLYFYFCMHRYSLQEMQIQFWFSEP